MAVTFGAVLLVLSAVLESTFVASVSVFGGRPDLVLLVVLAWAVLRGPTEGVVAGIVGGFALDTLSGTPFGFHTGILGVIGFSTSLGESSLYRGNLPFFFGAAVLSSVLYHLALALLLQLAGWEPPSIEQFARIAVSSALLNAALMPGLFWLVRRGVRWSIGWRQLEI